MNDTTIKFLSATVRGFGIIAGSVVAAAAIALWFDASITTEELIFICGGMSAYLLLCYAISGLILTFTKE